MAIGESIVKRSNRTSLSLAIHFILSPLQTFISDSQGTSSSNFTYRLPSIPINPLMIHTGRLEPSLVVEVIIIIILQVEGTLPIGSSPVYRLSPETFDLDADRSGNRLGTRFPLC